MLRSTTHSLLVSGLIVLLSACGGGGSAPGGGGTPEPPIPEYGGFRDVSLPENSTNSVALGDVDGDGDLDLVVGNFGQANRVYLNNNGTLTDSNQSLGSSATRSVAMGDVDGDGDLDLAEGNDGYNWIYPNLTF